MTKAITKDTILYTYGKNNEYSQTVEKFVGLLENAIGNLVELADTMTEAGADYCAELDEALTEFPMLSFLIEALGIEK